MTILTRAQILRGVQGIDITVKSAKPEWRALAPRWDMVMGHKNKTMTNEQYTAAYDAILDRAPQELWDRLASLPTATLLCYCRHGWFCHTHLAIEYAVRRWPDRFIDGRASESLPLSHPPL